LQNLSSDVHLLQLQISCCKTLALMFIYCSCNWRYRYHNA